MLKRKRITSKAKKEIEDPNVFSFDPQNPWTPPAFEDKQESYGAASTTNQRFETLEQPLTAYPNISNFMSPFHVYNAGAYMDTREAIALCMKAYWAYGLLRNVVEVMGELSNSSVYLKGGNQKTRDFIEAWFEKINFWQLKEQFFREWFRSGNCFLYRFEADYKQEDLDKMTQIYGASGKKSLKKTIPVKYILLNPLDITVGGNIAFGQPLYYKILNSYEISRLRNPQTVEDNVFLQGMDPETKKAVLQSSDAKMKLNPEDLIIVLYKCQPFEPMGVPMCFGAIKDIEAKLEMKRIDLSLARMTDRAILHIAVGETPNQWHKAGSNINNNTLAALQTLFTNEGISRTLITDYTVKPQWYIPDIQKILGAEKYEQIDKDISMSLNTSIFDTNEKFANTSIKLQIFIERLKEARNAFLNNFLKPEIIRVCKSINAKNYPEAIFEETTFKDEIQSTKIMISMAQLGFLTPEELFDAVDTGQLPTAEESLLSQEKFKELKDKGLYMPIIGGSTQIQKDQLGIQQQQVDNNAENAQQTNAIKAKQIQKTAPGVAGRPTGTKGPKASSAPKPMGSRGSLAFSMSKLEELVPLVSDIHNKIEKKVKKKYNVRKLTETQASLIKKTVENLISIESKDQWINKIDEYVESQKEASQEIYNEIDDLRAKYNIDSYLASMLRLVITEPPTK